MGTDTKHIYDLAILGNGIAGMTAAVYAKRAGLDFILIGQDEDVHGQVDNAISSENYMGLPFVSGYELGELFSEHLAKLDIDTTEDEVISVYKYCNPMQSYPLYDVSGEFNKIYCAKSVIYALGCTHKHLNVETVGNVHMHYCATCDGYLYKDKTVAVIGGGNSAFTEALHLSKICSHVFIVMCDDNITADKVEVDRVKSTQNITIAKNFPVGVIKDEGGKFLEVSCTAGHSPHCGENIMVDGVFVAIGMQPTKVDLWIYDLVKDQYGFIEGSEDCKTSSDGFFVAGDARTKRLRQCVTASADGANAVVSAIEYLDSISGR